MFSIRVKGQPIRSEIDVGFESGLEARYAFNGPGGSTWLKTASWQDHRPRSISNHCRPSCMPSSLAHSMKKEIKVSLAQTSKYVFQGYADSLHRMTVSNVDCRSLTPGDLHHRVIYL